MSRVGKKPINIPKGVTVTHDPKKQSMKAKGPKGENEMTYHPLMEVTIDKETIHVKRPDDLKVNKSLHGMTQRMIENLIIGVTSGFEKKLIINGIGFKADVKGTDLVLSLGFSHPVEMKMPKGVNAKAEKGMVTLTGIDKEVLGQFAADVRAKKPTEPYKGSGIRYENERVRKKAGKKAA
ncbi:MAG: 50S ribosomal protein L6 [Candidatus Wallbacteria bacterium]|nr:50S ribosomal protein L6 [Candidatus Wallbacteria bacterium]